MILTRKPETWREGQTIFNFLEWLHTEKGYDCPGSIQGCRMGDPFHISDSGIEELYKEFLKELA